MLVEYLSNKFLLRRIIYILGHYRARNIVKQIQSYIKQHELVLDVGSGTCNVCEILQKQGFKVYPLDVKDLSVVDGLKPVIYDGDKLPFGVNQFNMSLVLLVLHHTPSPEKIFCEARRVSKRMIVLEEIYTNKLHKLVTFILDSFFNFDFFDHPHTNKKDEEWRRLFKQYNMRLQDCRYFRVFLVLKQALYILEKQD